MDPIRRFLLTRLAESKADTASPDASTNSELPIAELATGTNLLPRLLAEPSDSTGSPAQDRDRRVQQRLLTRATSHTQLTWSLPGIAGQRMTAWLGPRLIWWPHGIPPQTRIGIVSSRLTRPLANNRLWFAVLRRICGELNPERAILVASQRTAAIDYLERCTQLFGIDLLRFEFGRTNWTWKRWLEKCTTQRRDPATFSRRIWSACVSPPLDSAWQATLPERDQAVVAAAARLIALRIRPAGNMQQLLTRRLSEGRDAAGTVVVAVGNQLTSLTTATPLRQLGAGLVAAVDMTPNTWPNRERRSSGIALVTPLDRDHGMNRPRQVCAAKVISGAAAMSFVTDFGPYLTHCTRQPNGPWPDETRGQYLDQLILERPAADHSAFATLRRITLSQQLLATGKTIRLGTRVVSFTGVPLGNIRQLYRYRQHRSRWDFEPYGICIHRQWLEDRGVRPVCYLDPSAWDQLAPDQRALFQIRTSGKRDEIDWSVEREWRHIGDLDLCQLSEDAAWLFVPTEREAEKLARVSRWPVVVVGQQWNATLSR